MGGRRTKDHVRVAWECGFRWAVDTDILDLAVPPDRDLVVLGLSEAQAAAALALEPETWWMAWGRGWVAGVASLHLAGGDDA